MMDFATYCYGLLVMFLYVGESVAVECYVCSWHPYDNKTDVCTVNNFDPEMIPTEECERGCEIVSMWDSNGEMEMFYRNCVRGSGITHEYVNKSSKLTQEREFTCDSDLCNRSPQHQAQVWSVILGSIILKHGFL